MIVDPVVGAPPELPPHAKAATATAASNANLTIAMVTTSPKQLLPDGKILLRPLRAGDLRHLLGQDGAGVASPRQGRGDHNRHAEQRCHHEERTAMVR